MNAKPSSSLMARIGGGVFAIFFVLCIIFVILKPSATGPYEELVGTVQSTGVISTGVSSSGSRGNAVVVLVKLENGDLIQARVESGMPIKPGTTVQVRKYRTGAYELSKPI